MIPKIIHYCWLSGDPFPESIQRCIDSWKKYLPDYELMLWDYKRFPRGKSKWVDEAFDMHKYAFAADFIRLYALKEYGGIYLDSDVEVLKPFDELLHLPYFIGQENTPLGIEAATLGCEKGWELIATLYERYRERAFVCEDGTTNEEPMPAIFRKCIESLYRTNYIERVEDFDYDKDTINIFPIDWFSPKTWNTRELKVTERTFSIHHFSGSWLDGTATKKRANYSVSLPVRVRRKLAKWYRQGCYRKFPVSIVTNVGGVAQAYYAFHFVRAASPLVAGQVEADDFRRLVAELPGLDMRRLSFIAPMESRHGHSDYYPIATLGDTDIEVSFPAMVSRQSVADVWARGCCEFDCRNAVVVLVDLHPGAATIEWLSGIDYPHVLITGHQVDCDYCLVAEGLTEKTLPQYDWHQKPIIMAMCEMLSSQIK